MVDLLNHPITVLDVLIVGVFVLAYFIPNRLMTRKLAPKREAISFEEAQRLVRPSKGAIWQHRNEPLLKVRIDRLQDHAEFGYPEVVYTILTDRHGGDKLPGASVMPLNGMMTDEVSLPGFLETFEPGYLVGGPMPDE